MKNAVRNSPYMMAIALALVAGITFTGCSDDDDTFGPDMTQNANIRVAHLSPDAPGVDVWVDGAVVLGNVPFEAVSDYLSLPPGTYRIQVTPAGATMPVVIDVQAALSSGQSVTAAATGLLGMNDLGAVIYEDDRTPTSGQAEVRFIHTSPDAPSVDVAVTGGPILFSNVAFREEGEQIRVAPGTYDLEVRLAGTSTVVLTVPGLMLSANTNYTVFATGLVSDMTLDALPVGGAS